MDNHIEVQTRNGVCRIAFSRPDKRNTLSSEMLERTAEAIEAAADDSETGAIVITGDGRTFSAGQDLADLRAGRTEPAAALLTAIEASPKPVVAAVNGPAVGLGCLVALSCDLVYAGAHSSFSLPYTALGLTPELGATALLVRAAGSLKAAEKLLLSEPISAAEALEMRLVSGMVEDGKVLELATGKAARLATLPPQAVAATRRLLRLARAADPAALAAAEAESARGRAAGPEAAECFAAFLEGRRPAFR